MVVVVVVVVAIEEGGLRGKWKGGSVWYGDNVGGNDNDGDGDSDRVKMGMVVEWNDANNYDIW